MHTKFWKAAGLLACALLSDDAQARTYMLSHTGEVRPVPGNFAKSQAFCNANPGFVALLTDRLVGADANGQLNVREGSSLNVEIELSIDAFCGLVGTQGVSGDFQLQYGLAATGSATPGADFSAATAAISVGGVPVFTSPIVRRTTLIVQSLPDSLVEGDEVIPVIAVSSLVSITVSGSPTGIIAPLGPSEALGRVVIVDAVRIGDTVSILLPEDAVAIDLARSLDALCAQANQDNELRAQCDNLRALLAAGNTPAVQAALRGLAPEEVATQSASIVEIRAGSQTERIQNRLASLRTNSSRRASTESNNFTLALSAVPGVLELNPAEASGGLLDQRWGGFLSGDFGRGHRDASAREQGFDYDRWGVTGGVDYRVSESLFLGAAAGFNSFEADLRDAGGSLRADVLALSGYGSYSISGGRFVEAAVSLAGFEFDQRRRAVYGTGSTRIDRTAVATFDAEQWLLTLSGGWPVAWGEWELTPSIGLEWSRTDTDTFAESGADALNLIVQGQDVYSSISRANLQAARSFSLPSGVLVAYANGSFLHEGRNESQATIARFINDSGNTILRIDSDAPDRNYAQIGAGVNYLLPGGLQLYADFRRVLSLRQFSLSSLSLGARVEF